jgi:hypothetical protein
LLKFLRTKEKTTKRPRIATMKMKIKRGVPIRSSSSDLSKRTRRYVEYLSRAIVLFNLLLKPRPLFELIRPLSHILLNRFHRNKITNNQYSLLVLNYTKE